MLINYMRVFVYSLDEWAAAAASAAAAVVAVTFSASEWMQVCWHLIIRLSVTESLSVHLEVDH